MVVLLLILELSKWISVSLRLVCIVSSSETLPQKQNKTTPHSLIAKPDSEIVIVSFIYKGEFFFNSGRWGLVFDSYCEKCLNVCVFPSMHVEARSRCWVSSLVALYYFLEPGSHTEPEAHRFMPGFFWDLNSGLRFVQLAF